MRISSLLALAVVYSLFGCTHKNDVAQPSVRTFNDSSALAVPSNDAPKTTNITSPFWQETRTLTPHDIEQLQQNESIIWGRIDNCGIYQVVEAPNSLLDLEARSFAAGQPVWMCIHEGSVLLGKIDFFLIPKGKRVELVFTNIQSGRRFQTQLFAGVSGGCPFYVVLPRGHYFVDIHFKWDGFEYIAHVNKPMTVPGERTIVYIGHLHMAVRKQDSAHALFDTGDGDKSREWFISKHPTFQGNMTTQRIVKQPVIVDKEGHLYYWHKKQ